MHSFLDFFMRGYATRGGHRVASLMQSLPDDVLALLDRREVPTLVVSGGKDVAVNRAAARATQQAAPRARYVHIPNACHAGMVGERDAVAAALAEFFRLERETNEFNRRRLMEATGMRSSPGSPAKVR